jgi:hypothetical protein
MELLSHFKERLEVKIKKTRRAWRKVTQFHFFSLPRLYLLNTESKLYEIFIISTD